ncbi:MAG: TIGR03915 family putative DNA repair protein [Pseudomonadota bacterium]
MAGRMRGAAACARAGRPLLVHSFAQWRAAARDLLAHQVAPHTVLWIALRDEGAPLSRAADPATVPAAPLRIPRTLMHLLQAAACCRVPGRWAFLYLVLWRWQRGERAVLSLADPDGARLHGMAATVRREELAMLAAIRFRERRADTGPPRFVAWCEPRHAVLARLARHFASRMGRVSFMIATPDASVLWDGARLHSTGALLRGPGDIDAGGDAAWPVHYRGLFHPPRLHADLMKNLP